MVDPPRNRRWPGWLRALLALAVVAVLLWMGTASARRQQRAVREIERLGGYVHYDFEHNSSEAPAPAWAIAMFGIDQFSHVLAAGYWRDSERGDSILAAAADLPRLKELECKGQATDAGLSHIRELTDLEVLVLEGTQVGDDGLAHLSKLAKLKDLDLGDKQPSAPESLRSVLPTCNKSRTCISSTHFNLQQITINHKSTCNKTHTKL